MKFDFSPSSTTNDQNRASSRTGIAIPSHSPNHSPLAAICSLLITQSTPSQRVRHPIDHARACRVVPCPHSLPPKRSFSRIDRVSSAASPTVVHSPRRPLLTRLDAYSHLSKHTHKQWLARICHPASLRPQQARIPVATEAAPEVTLVVVAAAVVTGKCFPTLVFPFMTLSTPPVGPCASSFCMLLCARPSIHPVPLFPTLRSVLLRGPVLAHFAPRSTLVNHQGCSGPLLPSACTSFLTTPTRHPGYEEKAVLMEPLSSDDRQPPPSTTKPPPSLR